MQCFETTNLNVCLLQTFKVGFSGPKTFRDFRERSPDLMFRTKWTKKLVLKRKIGQQYTIPQCSSRFVWSDRQWFLYLTTYKSGWSTEFIRVDFLVIFDSSLNFISFDFLFPCSEWRLQHQQQGDSYVNTFLYLLHCTGFVMSHCRAIGEILSGRIFLL